MRVGAVDQYDLAVTGGCGHGGHYLEDPYSIRISSTIKREVPGDSQRRLGAGCPVNAGGQGQPSCVWRQHGSARCACCSVIGNGQIALCSLGHRIACMLCAGQRSRWKSNNRSCREYPYISGHVGGANVGDGRGGAQNSEAARCSQRDGTGRRCTGSGGGREGPHEIGRQVIAEGVRRPRGNGGGISSAHSKTAGWFKGGHIGRGHVSNCSRHTRRAGAG